MKPLVFDLFCGLGGWSDSFIAEGYRAIGFDIEAHDYGNGSYPGELLLRDIRSISGAELVKQYGVPACIVASPPCQQYSYMSMPWQRAKQIQKALLGEGEFPEGYKGARTISELTDLFNQCFRVQREISQAAGHHVPMIVENVRGAQGWVGKARWNFGSYYLWGDVPALMPIPKNSRKTPEGSWDLTRKNYNADHTWKGEGIKVGISWGKSGPGNPGKSFNGTAAEGNKSMNIHMSYAELKSLTEGTKGSTPNSEPLGKNTFARMYGSKSKSRKQASAEIAKIPTALARWIAVTFKPKSPLHGSPWSIRLSV